MKKNRAVPFVASVIAPTEGNDTIEIGTGTPTEIIDGDGGIDTLQLKPVEGKYEAFVLSADTYKNIEVVQGTDAFEIIHIDARLFETVKSIDGKGGQDTIWIDISHAETNDEGDYVLDLRGVTIRNAQVSALDDWGSPVTVKLTDKETAFAFTADADFQWFTLDYSGTNIAFTDEELLRLYRKGIGSITDANGVHNAPFMYMERIKDTQVATSDATFFIDKGQNVDVRGFYVDNELPFTVDADPNIEISLQEGENLNLVEENGATHVYVDLDPNESVQDLADVGTVTMNSAKNTWRFTFNNDLTEQALETIIQNLTAKILSSDDQVRTSFIALKFPQIYGHTSSYRIPVKILPANAILLSQDTNSAPATDGDDKFILGNTVDGEAFSLRGGDGTDSLYLDGGGFHTTDLYLGRFKEFSGFERIVSDYDGSRVWLGAAQLADIKYFVGSQNSKYAGQLILSGDEKTQIQFDLRGKIFTQNYVIDANKANYSTIIIADKSVLGANYEKLTKHFSDGIRIKLVGDSFTRAERTALLETGKVTYIWDESDNGNQNSAPSLSNLDGDRVRFKGITGTTALDYGSDAFISDDGRIRKITINVLNDDPQDVINIEKTSSIEVRTFGNRIIDPRGGADVVFGHYEYVHSDASLGTIEILFNENATRERIDNLLQALRYEYLGASQDFSSRKIMIEAWDEADKVDVATVTVTGADEPGPGNPTPDVPTPSQPVRWKYLDNDHIYAPSRTTTFIDLGQNAEIINDGPLTSLVVGLVESPQEGVDLIGIATSGAIRLSNGMQVGSRVTVVDANGEHDIGALSDVWYGGFEIWFDDAARPELVQQLVRSITYTHLVDEQTWERQIAVAVAESPDSEYIGAITTITKASVTNPPTDPDPKPEPPPAPPKAPTAVTLSGLLADEFAATGTVVGTLSATDPDAFSPFAPSLRYTLLDNAGGRFVLEGNQIKVAKGIALDFEQAASHAIRVQVTDRQNLSTEAIFTIALRDINPEKVLGTAEGEIIKGGAKNDQLYGGAGNDTLYGGKGKDILRGDKGKDTFVFDTAPNRKNNVDKILAYSRKDDTIWLDNKVFKELGKGSPEKPVKLAANKFHQGTVAQDADDRIIYDPVSGKLFYDADGTGSKAAVQIAVLAKGLNMAGEFWVI